METILEQNVRLPSPDDDLDLSDAASDGLDEPTNPSKPTVSLTVIENAKGPATKAFALDEAGGLIKQSAAAIYEGSARRIEAQGLEGVMEVIENLPRNQALVYGVPPVANARIVTQEELRRGGLSNAIARDRENFQFAQGRPGVLMLDHDPRADSPRLGWQAIDAILCEAVPGWQGVNRVWRPSASAFIYDAEGKELIGAGGWRCYVIVDDASEIPNAGAYIYQALWEAGHGYILITKAGQALDRALVDPSVWQPERLDFAAAPVLGPGLERRAPGAEFIPGDVMLASAGLRPEMTISEWRAASTVRSEACEKVVGLLAQVRKKHIETLTAELKRRLSKTRPDRVRAVITRAVSNRSLGGEFLLYRPDGTSLTVAEILSDPEKWNGARFADPLEPDYRGDTRIAYANLRGNGQPFIYSHAHGGMRYALARESAEIQIVKGEQPRVVDQSLDLLRARGDVFERGGELVRIVNSGIAPVDDEWLLDYLGRHVRFTVLRNRRGDSFEERADAPLWLARRITAKRGERGVRELRGIITAPTMRPDGSLVVTPGFDDATGLFLTPGRWPDIPQTPSREELEAAAATLWKPFAEFPFVDETARSVMLATTLTGMVRQSLPLAPGTSFDAPDAGTGKTLLGKCQLVLNGMPPTVIPECRDEEEIRKRILPALRTGQPGVLFDNIRGQFGSAAIEALLTTENYSDRVLGASQLMSLPTRVQVLFSGNNFRPMGDLWRRILTARIDAKSDAPERRSFLLNPLAHCRDRRLAMVAAGLTLLRGFVAAGSPRTTTDKLASFEDWDDLVRQCVIWIGAQQLMPKGAPLGDPARSMDVAKEAEPERQKLIAFLSAVRGIFQDGHWRVGDLIQRADATSGAPVTSEETPAGALRDALHEIASERGTINAHRLGRWIQRHASRRLGGLWIERRPGRAGAAAWTVCGVSSSDQK